MSDKMHCKNLIVVLFLVFLTVSVTAMGEKPPGSIKAPDFTLEDLSGKPVSLSKFRGKNVVLNFWAPWCSPCRSEFPDFQKLSNSIKDKDIELVTVGIGETIDSLKQFMKKNNFNFRVLADPNGVASSKYRVRGIPVTYVINKEGKIMARVVGARPWSEKMVRKLIESKE